MRELEQSAVICYPIIGDGPKRKRDHEDCEWHPRKSYLAPILETR